MASGQLAVAQMLKAHISDSDRLVDSYREIETLWHINSNKNPLFRLALEEWQRKENELDHRASRRENKSIDLHTQIHNIIGWYAVFQGVLLTAVSQLSAGATTQGAVPLCGKVWCPIVLSGFGTFVAIVGIFKLFTELKSLEITINTEKKAKGEAARRANNLKRLGPQKFSFRKHTSNQQEFPQQPFWKNRIFLILSLLVFTGLFILSFFVILCNTWVVRKWDKGLSGY